jgi:hypothetical protein
MTNTRIQKDTNITNLDQDHQVIGEEVTDTKEKARNTIEVQGRDHQGIDIVLAGVKEIKAERKGSRDQDQTKKELKIRKLLGETQKKEEQ